MLNSKVLKCKYICNNTLYGLHHYIDDPKLYYAIKLNYMHHNGGRIYTKIACCRFIIELR